MMDPDRIGFSPLLSQVGLTVLVMAGIALAPPRVGMILLLYPGSNAAGTTLALAIDHGARLVAAGPLPRSIIVYGERDRLAAPLLARGILVLAAPSAGCVDVRRPIDHSA